MYSMQPRPDLILAYTHTCACMHTCAYRRPHAHLHIRVSIHTHTCIYVSVSTRTPRNRCKKWHTRAAPHTTGQRSQAATNVLCHPWHTNNLTSARLASRASLQSIAASANSHPLAIGMAPGSPRLPSRSLSYNYDIYVLSQLGTQTTGHQERAHA